MPAQGLIEKSTKTKKKKVFIETLGCQMNVADTERMLGLLDEINYEPTEDFSEADLSILNTCSIREHAVDKMRSYVGKWDKLRKPGSLVAVGGCVAQEKGVELQKESSTVDLVFGTHNLHRLPDLVLEAERKLDENALEADEIEKKLLEHKLASKEQLNNDLSDTKVLSSSDFALYKTKLEALKDNKGDKFKRAHTCETWEELPELIPETPIFRKTKHYAWVNVIYGCNYRCTYCIVPQTRGEQRSRPIVEIKAEIQALADEGYKEIILLGQNVDGYGLDIDGFKFSDGVPINADGTEFDAANPAYSEKHKTTLAKLLREIHPIEGIERIKFLTSHPCDMSFELIDTVAELPKVSKYFHVPIQAGNNEILRRMARRYTYERYMELVNYMRKKMPDVSITGDIIVGFPGETHEQFMDSVRAVQEIKYDACNTAIYSKRPNTPAATWEDDISEAEKQERIRFINAIITETAEKQAQRYLGRVEQVLVEGQSTRNPDRLAGRISNNKTLNFDCPIEDQEKYIGEFVDVKVTQANPWALRGELVRGFGF